MPSVGKVPSAIAGAGTGTAPGNMVPTPAPGTAAVGAVGAGPGTGDGWGDVSRDDLASLGVTMPPTPTATRAELAQLIAVGETTVGT